MTTPRTLAVVPARGGSKGLPGKNVRPLLGLPLIAHSLRCAASASALTRTIVSTDSGEIAAVARAHGGDVPFLRPPALAQDTTPMFPVITHALAEVERAEAATYDYVVLLDPTSPGRLPSDIDRAIAMLEAAPTAAGVVACSKPTFNPFWVGVVLDEHGFVKPAFEGANAFTRRQAVPDFFRINGALYAWRAAWVRAAPERWRDGPHLLLEIPEARAFSIDDLYEFNLAEALLERGLIELPWVKGGA